MGAGQPVPMWGAVRAQGLGGQPFLVLPGARGTPSQDVCARKQHPLAWVVSVAVTRFHGS